MDILKRFNIMKEFNLKENDLVNGDRHKTSGMLDIKRHCGDSDCVRKRKWTRVHVAVVVFTAVHKNSRAIMNLQDAFDQAEFRW